MNTLRALIISSIFMTPSLANAHAADAQMAVSVTVINPLDDNKQKTEAHTKSNLAGNDDAKDRYSRYAYAIPVPAPQGHFGYADPDHSSGQ